MTTFDEQLTSFQKHLMDEMQYRLPLNYTVDQYEAAKPGVTKEVLEKPEYAPLRICYGHYIDFISSHGGPGGLTAMKDLAENHTVRKGHQVFLAMSHAYSPFARKAKGSKTRRKMRSPKAKRIANELAGGGCFLPSEETMELITGIPAGDWTVVYAGLDYNIEPVDYGYVCVERDPKQERVDDLTARMDSLMTEMAMMQREINKLTGATTSL